MENKRPIRPLARLWVRGCDPNDGIILGVTFKRTRNSLKANHVYELREVLGEIVLKDLGPSWLGNRPGDPAYGQTLDGVLAKAEKYLVLTKKEYMTLVKETYHES